MITLWNDDQPVVALTYYATHPQSSTAPARRIRTSRAWPNAREQATGVPHIHFNGAGSNGAGKYNDGEAPRESQAARRSHGRCHQAHLEGDKKNSACRRRWRGLHSRWHFRRRRTWMKSLLSRNRRSRRRRGAEAQADRNGAARPRTSAWLRAIAGQEKRSISHAIIGRRSSAHAGRVVRRIPARSAAPPARPIIVNTSRGNGDGRSWLLIKHRDEWAGPVDVAASFPMSVKSNGDFEDILAQDKPDVWESHRPAKGGEAGEMLQRIIEKAAQLKVASGRAGAGEAESAKPAGAARPAANRPATKCSPAKRTPAKKAASKAGTRRKGRRARAGRLKRRRVAHWVLDAAPASKKELSSGRAS